MPADEGADAAAVHHRHTAQIDDQMPLAAAEELLDVPLEGLSGSPGDEGHLGREDEAVGCGTVVVSH